MGLKHCMGHIYTKNNYRCLSEILIYQSILYFQLLNQDTSEHQVFLATNPGGYSEMLAGSVMSQDITHPRACPWASGSRELGSSLFWELLDGGSQFLAIPHRPLPRAAQKMLSYFPSMRSKIGFKWKSLPISIQISKETAHSFCHILFARKKSVNSVHIQERGLPKAPSKKQGSMEISQKLPTVGVFPKNEIF